MYDVMTKSFEVTSGCQPLELCWESGMAADMPNNMVAVRVPETNAASASGYEWATARVTCPMCGTTFPVASCASEGEPQPAVVLGEIDLCCWEAEFNPARHIAESLLDAGSIWLVDMVGNLSIETDEHHYARCPRCAHEFPVAMNPSHTRIDVIAFDNRVEVAHPCFTVTYTRRGLVYTSKSRTTSARLQAQAFENLPQFVGVSAKARAFIELALGIRLGMPAIADGIDLVDVALRNRFKGYDEAFYVEAHEILTRGDLPCKAREKLLELPRYASDHERLVDLFVQSGLPDAASVRRAAAHRPALLALLAATEVGLICGDDPNHAVKLLESSRVSIDFFCALCNPLGELCALFEYATKADGATPMMKRLLKMSDEQICWTVRDYSSLALTEFQTLKSFTLCRRVHKTKEIFADPKLLLAYVNDEVGWPLAYPPELEALEGDFDGYAFRLPRNTKRFVSAASSLKNCLAEGYAGQVALGRTLIVLVSKICNGKLVAALEVNPSNRMVVQARGKANRDIGQKERLSHALAMWKDVNGIGDLSLPPRGI